MDVEKLKISSLDLIREEYRQYLTENEELEENTISTACTDSFYLYRKVSEEFFWETVLADSFEDIARFRLEETLRKYSAGNVDTLVNGYLSHLRRFRSFLHSNFTPKQNSEDFKAIKNFLLNIDCLTPLAKWAERFNLFDILKITKTEIRHSNILAWLLTPDDNHGMSDAILKGFIQYVVTAGADDQDAFKILLMHCHDFEILREWSHIDVIAISHSQEFVLCIENKIDSGEHDNQLTKYRETIEEKYPDYLKRYIYLTPEGDPASESEHWLSMSYGDVIKIIENVKQKYQVMPEVALLIDNYLEAVRRDIVRDENLIRICEKIYSEHRRALDLIYEYKPDRAADLASIFKSWVIEKENNRKGKLHIDFDKSTKTITKFTTDTMSMLLPDLHEPVSGWSTKKPYYYEIVNRGDRIFIQFVVSSKGLTDYHNQVIAALNKHFPSKIQKERWQWRTYKANSRPYAVDDDYTMEQIIEKLDEFWAEMEKYEKKVCETLHEEGFPKAATASTSIP
ncbi:PDDEXK-like family protein [Methanospirillum sp.]